MEQSDLFGNIISSNPNKVNKAGLTEINYIEKLFKDRIDEILVVFQKQTKIMQQLKANTSNKINNAK